MTDTSWQNRVTLLVNSCDAYADLWQPFFTLLKRYFVPLPAEILLNTETKDFAFDGLNLRCVHSTAPTYGRADDRRPARGENRVHAAAAG